MADNTPGSSQAPASFVSLDDSLLKRLDIAALVAVPVGNILPWLRVLDDALRYRTSGEDRLISDLRLSGLPLERGGNTNLTTSGKYFYSVTSDSKLTDGQLYFLEGVLLAHDLLRALTQKKDDSNVQKALRTLNDAETTQKFEEFNQKYANSTIDGWLEDVAEANVVENTVDEIALYTQRTLQKIQSELKDGILAYGFMEFPAGQTPPPTGEADGGGDSAGVPGGTGTSGGEGDGGPIGSAPPSGGGDAETPGPETPPQHDEEEAGKREQQQEPPPYPAGNIKAARAPLDVMRLLEGHRAFSAAEAAGRPQVNNHQFMNESAWVMQGVLAQLYPDYLGKMQALPPEVLDKVREAVIAGVGEAAASGNLGTFSARLAAIRVATLTSLHSLQQAGITDAQVLAYKAGADPKDANSTTLPSRTDLIEQQLPELTQFIASQITESGGALPDPSLLSELAYNQLAVVSTDALLGVAAGVPVFRQKIFTSASKAVANSLLEKGLVSHGIVDQLAYNRLNGIIAERLTDGSSPDEILAELNALSDEALTELLGITITAENSTQLRAVIQQQTTQRLIVLFNAPPTGASVSAIRGKVTATFASQMTSMKESGEDIDANPNSASIGHESASKKARSFLKYYQTSWSVLSQDEQIVVYMLAGLNVNKKFFDSNPNLENLPLPFEYLEYATATQSPKFQQWVQTFSKNRHEFASYNQRQEIIKSWKAGDPRTIVGANLELQQTKEYLQGLQQLEYTQQLLAYEALSKEARLRLALAAGFSSWEAYQQELRSASLTKPEFYTPDRLLVDTAVQTPNGLELVKQVHSNPMHDAAYATAILGANTAAELTEANNQHLAPDLSAVTPGAESINSDFYKHQMRNPNGLVSSAFKKARQKIRKKLAGKLAGKGLSAAAKMAAGTASTAATMGLAALAAIATNKDLRNIALAGATILSGLFINGASSLFGIIGGIGGGIGGFLVGGPAGAVAGAVTGTIAGGLIDHPWNVRFANARPYPTGLNPREAPMESIRASQAPPPPSGAQTGGTNTGGADSGAGQTAGATSTAMTPTSMAASAIIIKTAVTTIIPTAFAPAVGVGTVITLTMIVMTVIWGAFLIETPSEPVDPANTIMGAPEENPYITIRKIASPQKIPNQTPTTISYRIMVEAKSGYAVKINTVKDTFSAFYDADDPETAPANSSLDNLQSGLDTAAFGTELITTTVAADYSLDGLSGFDAYLANRVEFTFDVYANTDLETPLKSSQKASAAAYVIIGNPKIGCWPTAGQITQLESEFSGFSHRQYNSDAFDISPRGGSDRTIYAPLPGQVCALEERSGSTFTGYGKYVKLSTSFGGADLVLVFGHMSQFISLSPNQCKTVMPGEPIGIIGSTGNSTGDHLHYELNRNSAGIRLRDLIIGGKDVKLNQIVSSCYSK